MGVLGDVLELAATSQSRWHSMRATVTEYSHHARQQQAMDRGQPSFLPKRTSPPGDPWTAKFVGQPADHTSNAAIWATAADRYRIEAIAEANGSDDQGQGVRITVRNGLTSWMMTTGGELIVHDRSTSFGGPLETGPILLLQPKALLSAHSDVQPSGVSQVDGRATVGAVLRGPADARSAIGPMPFWPGWLGDETTIELDAATGIIVRLRSTVDGELMRSFALTGLVINDALESELFTEQPPANVPTRSATQQPDPVAVVAKTVEFTLFAPAGVDAMAFASSPSAGHQVVSVHIMPTFGNNGRMMVPTMIQQSTSMEKMPTTDEWETIALSHGPGWIWQAAPDEVTGVAGEVHIRVDRQGTHIWLRGPHDRAEAVDLADRLEPVVPAS